MYKKIKIYRTNLAGSIEIKLNKNGYKIRTCRVSRKGVKYELLQ